MVQQNQFGGGATEDPNLHLSIFLEYCDTLKLNGVTNDAIRLRLFPFSLKDKARAWLHSLPAGSITTWDQLSREFLAKYFPPSKTAQMRNRITSFVQKEGESLYEAWECYKELLRMYPHHGLEKWLIVHTFYNGLTYNTRMTVDAAAGGVLMNKTIDEVESLSINSVASTSIACEICCYVGHSALECQLGNPSSLNTSDNEHVNYVNNFNQKGDPFSNTYNPG
ncbi:uncharacterized protein LOC109823363 [Asparagus officinalis]|uniref:uncharacterized protein LOC109823363 n=1 Tax=Asparagus officinalis TaxID=4686 RepID=UPI00098E012C|nr:uncharacterized protein LOC109823363 [Asparagus officinalis]